MCRHRRHCRLNTPNERLHSTSHCSNTPVGRQLICELSRDRPPNGVSTKVKIQSVQCTSLCTRLIECWQGTIPFLLHFPFLYFLQDSYRDIWQQYGFPAPFTPTLSANFLLSSNLSQHKCILTWSMLAHILKPKVYGKASRLIYHSSLP